MSYLTPELEYKWSLDPVMSEFCYCSISSCSVDSGPCDITGVFCKFFFNFLYQHLAENSGQCTLFHCLHSSVFMFWTYPHFVFPTVSGEDHIPAFSSNMWTDTEQNFLTFGQFLKAFRKRRKKVIWGVDCAGAEFFCYSKGSQFVVL